MSTVVLIPCYNEGKTIKTVVEDFAENLPDADIYVYDNNSTDDTYEVVENLQHTYPNLYLRKERRQGKGNVMRTMFREIEADCYIIADGDDTYPAEFAPEFEKMILNDEADMVVGDRLSSSYFEENKRPFHNFGNVLVRWLINRLFKANLHDIMTGARAFSRDFVKSYAILNSGFEIETDMTIFALDNNFRIVELPIRYKDRVEGSVSKLNTYSDGAKVIMTIIRLFRDVKPKQFFTIVSLILFAIGTFFFIPVMVAFIKTGTVEKFPTLIATCAVYNAAIITFFVGVILNVLRRYEKSNFERYLNRIRK